MSQITISLDAERQERLTHRAAEIGCRDIGEMINLLLDRELEDAEIEAIGAPVHLTVRTDAELEQLLVSRVDDPRPPIEVTPKFWDDIRRQAGLPTSGEPQP